MEFGLGDGPLIKQRGSSGGRRRHNLSGRWIDLRIRNWIVQRLAIDIGSKRGGIGEDELNLPSGAYEIPLVIFDRSFSPDGSSTIPFPAKRMRRGSPNTMAARF